MPKTIHFSIDDVLPSLKYFTEHQDTFNSLWELDFYKKLRYFHEKYGLIVTLNLFDQARGFSIDNVSNTIKNDFMKAKDWLYLSFHGRETEKEFYVSDNIHEFIKSYESVEHFSNYMQGRNLSEIARIHFFEAGKKQIEFLYKKGVTTLLTADDNRISYGLSQNIYNDIENKHSIIIDKMMYVHSDYRIENIKNIEKGIIEMKKKENLVLFTHEWCFIKKVEFIEKILYELINNYTYISVNNLIN